MWRGRPAKNQRAGNAFWGKKILSQSFPLLLLSGFDSSGGVIDLLNQRDASAPLAAVAHGSAVVLNCLQEVFDDNLVPAKIANHGRRNIFLIPRGNAGGKPRRSIAQIRRDNSILLQDYGAFRTRELQPPRISGIGRRRGLDRAHSAAP